MQDRSPLDLGSRKEPTKDGQGTLSYQPVDPWGTLRPMEFAYENIGISHLCAKTHVFLHTFGDRPETFKNQYKSTLGVLPFKYAYKTGMNKVESELCSLHMEPVLDFGGRRVHHDSGDTYLEGMCVLGSPRVPHDSP